MHEYLTVISYLLINYYKCKIINQVLTKFGTAIIMDLTQVRNKQTAVFITFKYIHLFIQ